MKGQKRDKNEFVTKFVRIIFIKKYFLNPCKIFPTHCFFTDHLKSKTLNKKQLVERPQQILASYVNKSSLTAMIIFKGF